MNETEKGTTLTRKALEAFIRAPVQGAESAAVDSAQGAVSTTLLDTAAVLANCDPFKLRSFGAMPDDQRDAALEGLIAASEPAPSIDGRRPVWTMKLLERRTALQRLGTRGKMKQALATSPVTRPPALQRMFAGLITGDPPSLATAKREEIAALLTAREWLDGIVDGLPSIANLQEGSKGAHHDRRRRANARSKDRRDVAVGGWIRWAN